MNFMNGYFKVLNGLFSSLIGCEKLVLCNLPVNK